MMGVASLQGANVSGGLASLKEVLTAVDLGGVDLCEVTHRPTRGPLIANPLIVLTTLKEPQADMGDLFTLRVCDDVGE